MPYRLTVEERQSLFCQQLAMYVNYEGVAQCGKQKTTTQEDRLRHPLEPWLLAFLASFFAFFASFSSFDSLFFFPSFSPLFFATFSSAAAFASFLLSLSFRFSFFKRFASAASSEGSSASRLAMLLQITPAVKS